MAPQLDPVGQFIFNLHWLLGHRGASAWLRAPEGDPRDCILCLYNFGKVSQLAVWAALYPSPQCPVPAVPRGA